MPGDLVTVASYPTAVEAETVRGLLEGEGIRVFLVDAEIATVRPEGWAPTFGVGLQVVRADAARALELVRRLEEEARDAREAEADGEEGGTETCLSCGAAFPEYLERCPACGLSYS